MNTRVVFSICFLVLFALLLVQLGILFRPFLYPILWAMILARLTYPLYVRLRHFLNCRENPAAAVMTLAVTLLIVIPTIYVAVQGIQQGVQAYEDVSKWVQEGGLKHAGESIGRIPWLGRMAQPLVGSLVVTNGGTSGGLEMSILEGGKSFAGFLVTQGGDLLKNVTAAGMAFLIMLFTLFFLFRDGDDISERIYRAIPLEEAHKARIYKRLNLMVTAVVRGTLVSAIAQGVVAGLTYAVLGIPFAIVLGALSALLALLPVGGTAFVWVPVAIYLFGTGAIVKGIVMVFVGSCLVGLMDNVLYPWLVGRDTKLPVPLLFFASLGGAAYFGFIGLFLGPILLAAALAAFQIYEEEFEDNGTESATSQSNGRRTGRRRKRKPPTSQVEAGGQEDEAEAS